MPLQGSIYNTVKHTFIPQGSSRSGCKDFFTRFDRAFREYMANLRANLLVEKNTCCSSDKWTAPWKKDAIKKGTGPSNTGHDIVKTKGCDTHFRWGVMGNPELKMADPKTNVGYCPIAKAWDRRKDLCNGEVSKPKRGVAGKRAQRSPGGMFKDVTSLWIHKMKLSCKKHGWISSALQAVNEGKTSGVLRIGGPRPLDALQAKKKNMSGRPVFSKPIPKWARFVDDNLSLAVEKIVCQEDSYPEAARYAFYAAMQDRYFMPRLQVTGKHSVELSCGTQQSSLDIYGQDINYVKSFDRHGKDVTGTFEALKMDGGKCSQTGVLEPGARYKDYRWYNYMYAAQAKAWIRRRASGLLTIPTFSRVQQCYGARRKFAHSLPSVNTHTRWLSHAACGPS